MINGSTIDTSAARPPAAVIDQTKGLVPLRGRRAPCGTVFVAESGRFFRSDDAFCGRLAANDMVDADIRFLTSGGYIVGNALDLPELAHRRSIALRSHTESTLDYLILVPTLRCNLSCSYCQVSRASENSSGHDWNDETLAAVLELIARMTAPAVKIEFQGGEPTLRPDLIEAVINACARFERADFVICTNLSRLNDTMLALFDRPNVYISTSLDGTLSRHRQQRTASTEATECFSQNLDRIIHRYGPTKVSALPTIDPDDPPPVEELIDAFASRGLNHIFLRPINYQGFARKRHARARERGAGWYEYHRDFVHALIARNWADRSRVLEEVYLSLCLRRIFQPGQDRHVDLRNPNPAGLDYILIDYDGAAYPTDEARMLTRSGVIDLRIGDVFGGWDTEPRRILSERADNRLDPTCNACAYQPFCGRDVIDDLARYGTIDLPREDTEFCRRHLHMFDLAFELIYDSDPAVQHSVRRWLRLRGDAAPLGTTL